MLEIQIEAAISSLTRGTHSTQTRPDTRRSETAQPKISPKILKLNNDVRSTPSQKTNICTNRWEEYIFFSRHNKLATIPQHIRLSNCKETHNLKSSKLKNIQTQTFVHFHQVVRRRRSGLNQDFSHIVWYYARGSVWN